MTTQDRSREVGMGWARYWTAGAFILVCLPFLGAVLCFNLHLDLWFDEIESLTQFIFVPLKKTVTYYPLANNHIFFSLLSNLYLKAIGAANVFTVLADPSILRLPLLFCSLGAIYLTYLSGRLLAGRPTGLLAAAILATTIPFFNFSVQVRGYSLSALLVALEAYLFFRHLRAPNKALGVLLAACAALLCYTLPTNLPFLLAMLACGFFPDVKETIARKGSMGGTGLGFFLTRLKAGPVVSLASGLLVGALLYWPVRNEPVFSMLAARHGYFTNLPGLFNVVTEVASAFTSGRLFLVTLASAGLLVSLGKGRWRSPGLASLAVMLAAPFLAGWASGVMPYDRVFVVLAPVFALWVALFLWQLVANLRWLYERALWVVLAVILACNIHFALEIRGVRQALAEDLRGGRQQQNIYHNYYLAHYRPREALLMLKRRQEAHPGPAALLEEGDNPACYWYAKLEGVKFFPWDTLMATGQSRLARAYLLTANPEKLRRRLAKEYPRYQFTPIAERDQFFSIFDVTKKIAGEWD